MAVFRKIALCSLTSTVMLCIVRKLERPIVITRYGGRLGAKHATSGRQYSEEVDFGIVKKPRSIFDMFSKKKDKLDPEFVALLRCPITKKELRYDEAEDELIQDEAGIVYHVVDGVPILTPSAAKSLHNFVEPEEASKKGE